MQRKNGMLKLAIATLAMVPLFLTYARAADSCQPLADAVGKLITTPTRIYSTAKVGGGAPTLTEMVLINGVVYGKLGSGWMKTNLTTRDMVGEELGTTKGGSCRYVKDEAFGGEAAFVYLAESASGGSEIQVWVSKTKGLPLHEEVDVKAKNGNTHMSIRYEYTNVQVPKI